MINMKNKVIIISWLLLTVKPTQTGKVCCLLKMLRVKEPWSALSGCFQAFAGFPWLFSFIPWLISSHVCCGYGHPCQDTVPAIITRWCYFLESFPFHSQYLHTDSMRSTTVTMESIHFYSFSGTWFWQEETASKQIFCGPNINPECFPLLISKLQFS